MTTTLTLWRAARRRALPVVGRAVLAKLAADEVATRAAALAFFALLSLIPVLLIVSQVLGAVDAEGPGIGATAVESLKGVAPRSVVALLMRTLGSIDRNPAPLQSLSVGAVVALWSGSRGLRAAVRAIDVAYGASSRRTSWRGMLIGVGLTLALAALVVVALLLMFHGPEVGRAIATELDGGAVFDAAWRWLQWPAALAFVLTGAELVYRFAPGRDRVRWRAPTPGGIVFLVVWLAASLLMRTYFRTFADLGFAYGPLGAVVMLTLWLYLSSAALIIGGEVNAVLRGAPRTGPARAVAGVE